MLEEEGSFVILRNSARCTRCGECIESRRRHDYAACSCGGAVVDGGREYLRRGGEHLQDTSWVVPEESRTHTLEHSSIQVHDVHHSALCEGLRCSIHHRSGHAMRSWPQEFSGGIMWRIAPDGQRHPDPDDMKVQAIMEVLRGGHG
jgi:hypothetical protein